MTREFVHATGRILTRALLDPRWRHAKPIASIYLHLYLLGKRLTERKESATIQRLLVPGMVVADVGANVGFYTLQIASSVGPSGRVLAFEPDPFCFELLRGQVARARASNVELHQLAIGEKDTNGVLYCSAYNRADNRMHGSHREPHVEQYPVRVRTLDSVLADARLTRCDAIKIDVQGAEEAVLRGAATSIGAGPCWIWLEFSAVHLRGAGTDPRAFLASLGSLNMEIYELNGHGRFRPLTDPEDYVRRIGSGYGDLLLTSSSRCLHMGLTIPT